MSRHQALKMWRGDQVIEDLARSGILIRTRSYRGAAEEAPGAYKDVDLVVEATEAAGLARRVAHLHPACASRAERVHLKDGHDAPPHTPMTDRAARGEAASTAFSAKGFRSWSIRR